MGVDVVRQNIHKRFIDEFHELMLPQLENIDINSQKLDNIKTQRKELKRIDWDTVKRILELVNKVRDRFDAIWRY